MLPAIIAALAPMLIGEVAKQAMGDTSASGMVADAAVSVVSQVADIPITDEGSAKAAADAIAADPAKLAEAYRLQAESVITLLRLDNDDRAGASDQTVALVQAGSRIAWGAPVVSLVVLLTFGLLPWARPDQGRPSGAGDGRQPHAGRARRHGDSGGVLLGGVKRRQCGEGQAFRLPLTPGPPSLPGAGVGGVGGRFGIHGATAHPASGLPFRMTSERISCLQMAGHPVRSADPD